MVKGIQLTLYTHGLVTIVSGRITQLQIEIVNKTRKSFFLTELLTSYNLEMFVSRESRQGGVTRSEMTRRTVHTARSSLGSKLEKNSSERILESASMGEIGHKTQSNCDCEKCIQRFVMRMRLTPCFNSQLFAGPGRRPCWLSTT